MNYAEMSDFEINKAVHLVLLKKGKIKEQFRISKSDFVDVFRNSLGEPSVIAVMRYVVNGSSDGYNPFGGAFNYCNNPSDAWSIIVENKIGITFVNGEWRASSVAAGYHEFSNINALRAVCCCFLLMNNVDISA